MSIPLRLSGWRILGIAGWLVGGACAPEPDPAAPERADSSATQGRFTLATAPDGPSRLVVSPAVPSGAVRSAAVTMPAPDEVNPSSPTPDTVSLEFGLADQVYRFNPGEDNTLSLDVRVRNNFAAPASLITVVLTAIAPPTGRAVIGDDRPNPLYPDALGLWRYRNVASGAWSDGDTWTFTVPNNSLFQITGEVYITFGNLAPTAEAGGPYAATPPSDQCASGGAVLVTLDASGSTDPDPGDALDFRWDLDGDGSYDDAGGVSVPLTFAQMGALGIGTYGAHTVAVQAVDTSGATSTDTATLDVADVPLAVVDRRYQPAAVDGSGFTGHVVYRFNRRPDVSGLDPSEVVFWDRVFDQPYAAPAVAQGCEVIFTPERPIGFNFDWELALASAAEVRDEGGNAFAGPDSYTFRSPHRDQVVYLANYPPAAGDPFGWDLYTCDGNGAGRRRVTFDAGTLLPSSVPRWSYDGLSILYAQRNSAGGPTPSRLLRYDLVTRTQEEMVPFEEVVFPGEPTLSPDGRQLAFTAFPLYFTGHCSDNDAPCTLADRSACLNPSAAYCLGSGRCADTGAICTIANPPSGCGLCVANGYCSNNKEPCDNPSNPSGINLSYCAASPAPSCLLQNRTVIHVMDLEAGTQRRLPSTSMTLSDRTPVFSPDGRHLIFVSGQSGSAQAWRWEAYTGDVAARNQLTASATGLYGGIGWHYAGRHAVAQERISGGPGPIKFLDVFKGPPFPPPSPFNSGSPFVLNQSDLSWGSFSGADPNTLIALETLIIPGPGGFAIPITRLVRVTNLDATPIRTPIVSDATEFAFVQWYFGPVAP